MIAEDKDVAEAGEVLVKDLGMTPLALFALFFFFFVTEAILLLILNLTSPF